MGVRDREALHDSVPPWQHSLWPDTGGRGRSVRAKTMRKVKGRRERGEEQVMSVRLGVSCHREKRRSGEDSAAEGELDPSQ